MAFLCGDRLFEALVSLGFENSLAERFFLGFLVDM
jgi:hypothetical protein